MHAWNEGLERFRQDLEQTFGRRLRSILAYDTHFGLETPIGSQTEQAPHIHTLVLVDTLTFADLLACAGRAAAWNKANVATPLLMTQDEFDRSLDAFPLELAAIRWHHALIAGADPFDRVQIDDADLRRACETQAKSHLLHLREGFLEAHGEPGAVARLIALSVPSLRAILVNMARLDGVAAKSRDALVHHAAARLDVPVALFDQLLAVRDANDLPPSDAHRIYTGYLDAAERLARFIDTWKAA